MEEHVMTSNDFMELMAKEESLNSELKDYVEDGVLGPMIKHPLVYHRIFDPNRNALINKHFEYKKQMLAEALEKKKWGTFIFLHERPYRMSALMEAHNIHGLDGVKFRKYAGEVWVDSENIWQYLPLWRMVWRSIGTEHRADYMDEDEIKKIEELSEEIPVWRGTHYKKAIKGLSWTLNKKRAEFFAHQLMMKDRKAILVEGTVKKSDVYALFLRRNEDEIVAEKVKIKSVAELSMAERRSAV
jgi:hypothetical protein